MDIVFQDDAFLVIAAALCYNKDTNNLSRVGKTEIATALCDRSQTPSIRSEGGLVLPNRRPGFIPAKYLLLRRKKREEK